MSFLSKTTKSRVKAKSIEVFSDLDKERRIVNTAKIPYLFEKPVQKQVSIAVGTSWTVGIVFLLY